MHRRTIQPDRQTDRQIHADKIIDSLTHRQTAKHSHKGTVELVEGQTGKQTNKQNIKRLKDSLTDKNHM